MGGRVISLEQPRRLADTERGLLIALSGLIARTLERARLYDAERHRAQELQRGLLPRALPLLPAVTVAARYLPASEGMLGGDWYDVIPLSGDRVALVIGDVMGLDSALPWPPRVPLSEAVGAILVAAETAALTTTSSRAAAGSTPTEPAAAPGRRSCSPRPSNRRS